MNVLYIISYKFQEISKQNKLNVFIQQITEVCDNITHVSSPTSVIENIHIFQMKYVLCFAGSVSRMIVDINSDVTDCVCSKFIQFKQIVLYTQVVKSVQKKKSKKFSD